MARSNSKTRRIDDESPGDSPDEIPRGVRIDPPHTAPLDPRIAVVEQSTAESVTLSGGPHVEWEPESISAADAALVAAWDELHAPAYALESPRLDTEDSSPVVEPRTAANSDELAAIPTMLAARTQLQQLSRLLADRQTEIDRRETNLHSRIAELEHHERGVKLWLREQHADFAAREAALAEREKLLETRETVIVEIQSDELREKSTREDETRRTVERVDARESRLREWEINLSERTGRLELYEHQAERERAELADRAACLNVEAELLSRKLEALNGLIRQYLRGETPTALEIHSLRAGAEHDSLDDQADWAGVEWRTFVASIRELAERRNRIERTETSLAESERDLTARCAAWERESQAWERRVRDERRASEDERKQFESAETHAREARLDALQESETRREALETLQAEMLAGQQELLKERLALEELLTEYAGRIPATRYTDARLRSEQKLAEAFRLQIERLTEERHGLEALLERLPGEHERLAERRRELEQWWADRRTDLSGLVARVSAREQELEQAAEILRGQEESWARERRVYETELRTLMTELGR